MGAFALRLWGINFGLPSIYRPDEDVVVGRAMGVLHGTLDPHFANWPHLYMYASAAWLALVKPLFPLFGPAAPYLAVRILDATLGALTVLMLYRLGRRAYGDLAGLLSALFLAVAFLAVRDSHFATIDIPLTFACVAGLNAALQLAESDRTRNRLIGGVLVGLAASLKYNGALLLASLAVAQAQHRRPAPRTALALTVIGLLAVAAFVLTSPFLLIDIEAFAVGVGYIFHQLSSANQPEIGYIHIPRLALWYGLDPPLFLLSLYGIAYALVRRSRADWIFLAFVLAYYALLGAGFSVFVRYADPLLPPLVLLGARALADTSARLTRPALATAFAVVIIALPALVHDLAYAHLVQQQDTRTQAFDWLSANVPAGSRVATLYFAGPAHDQGMIDRRDQSHGAPNEYVASFLQNRLEDRYSVHDLAEGELRSNTLTSLKSDGVSYVVYSSTTPAGGCAPQLPLRKALSGEATLRATFSPTDGKCTNAVFDPIDGYYVPIGGYEGWVRPGPTIEIFALR
ncbi:MAG TPA: glycosyltransferase family 39 protein [Candidatus Dormibacteraeota bacterium]